MKLPTLAALALFLGSGFQAGAAPAMAVPQNVTIQTGANGVSRLLWDPMYDEELLGYSIWKRFEGSGADFTRIVVPVKVGKEVKKMPITSQARYSFKDPAGKPAEFVVVAEYTTGRSRPSASVRTRLAKKAKGPAGPEGEKAPEEEGATPPGAEAAAEPTPAPTEEPTPDYEEESRDKDLASPLKKRALLAPRGRIRTWLGIKMERENRRYKGTYNITLGRETSPGVFVVEPHTINELWHTRQVILAPFGLEYGLLPGFEIGVETAWADMKVSPEDINVGGQNFTYTGIIETAWMGETLLRARLQPLTYTPVALGVTFSLPTGVSRLKTWAEFNANEGSGAGTGLGVSRLGIEAVLGDRWNQGGPFYFVRYQPSATESLAFRPKSGTAKNYDATYGEVMEAGGGFSKPFELFGQKGMAAITIAGESISSGRLQEGGKDLAASLPDWDKPFVESISGISFTRDDRLTLAFEFEQGLGKGITSRGKLYYITRAGGSAIGLSGSFHY